MKRLIIMLMVIAMATVAAGQAYYSSGQWRETECVICGISTHTCVESSILGPSTYGDYGQISSCGWIDSVKQETAFQIIERPICSSCREKHEQEFFALIDKFYAEKRVDNFNSITLHEEERRKRAIEDKKEKIEKLHRELQELNK